MPRTLISSAEAVCWELKQKQKAVAEARQQILGLNAQLAKYQSYQICLKFLDFLIFLEISAKCSEFCGTYLRFPAIPVKFRYRN